MIIELLLNVFMTVIKAVFSWISLPDFPPEVAEGISTFFNFIFDNCSLLSFFIRPQTIKIVVPIVILACNFEHIYHFTIWILKKIPMLNIH